MGPERKGGGRWHKDSGKKRPRHAGRGWWRMDVSRLLTALIVMMAVFGAGIMLYPTFADLYNRAHASQTISGYNEAVEQQTREKREEIWNGAEEYNEALAARTIAEGGTINFWQISDDWHEQYQNALKVEDEGLMGYVSIPEIDVYLPIGHGVGEKVLQMGVGHLEGSSLPVGGESTHSVITGHTGLPSAKLFTDLDKLEKGDTFQLVILNETLTYEVSDIQVVLPTDVGSLKIEEGKDLCTLLTCTPYGINDHRLLVTGQRVETPEGEQVVSNNGLTFPVVLLVVAVVGVVAAVVVSALGLGRGKRMKVIAGYLARLGKTRRKN